MGGIYNLEKGSNLCDYNVCVGSNFYWGWYFLYDS